MSETLTAGQRQTADARRVFAERFKSPQEKSAYFRELARGRLVLSAEEAEALVGVYDLLSSIAARVEAKKHANGESA